MRMRFWMKPVEGFFSGTLGLDVEQLRERGTSGYPATGEG
jgi:hypothetical protein